MAIRQAVQRAPQYPESHNINGLVSEVRSDFESAITFYQHARFALGMNNSKSANRYAFADVSVNLVRSLCRVRVNCCDYIWSMKLKYIKQNHVSLYESW